MEKNFKFGKPSIQPPDPLPQRNFIPLASPRFGSNIPYIKLKPFILNEINQDNITSNDKNERFEKNCELNYYLNCTHMIDKLVYLRNELTDNKIVLDNLVNLRSKKINKKKIFKDYYKLKDPNDNTLIFESRFESGNLHSAFKEESNSYQIVIQNDTNTLGYSHWFFFRVKNVKKGMKVKFNIINFLRPKSLYASGMRIAVYSEKIAENNGVGWHKDGENIGYYKNSLYKFSNERKRSLYSLIFTYEFKYDDDIVYFANNVPYTYTDIMNQLNEYQKNDKKYDFFFRKSLCETLAGNSLDYFTLDTSFANPIKKDVIIIMARVHPGETVSSWVMNGVIELLMGESDEAKYLKEKFVFKIIPMLNPDGVINGNYRTSIAGCDLNRRWNNPNQIIHPEIFNARNMILKVSENNKISFIVDLHGHSGAFNTFIYANNIKEEPYICKIFPFIYSRVSNIFNYNQCTFTMPKYKNGTSRIHLFRELDIPNIFTVETSFAGYISQKHILYNLSHLKSIGKDLCRSIITYTQSDLYIYEIGLKDFYNKKNQTLENNETFKEAEEEDEDASGSDSEPSMDNIDVVFLKNLLPKGKTKIKKMKGEKSLKFFPSPKKMIKSKVTKSEVFNLNMSLNNTNQNTIAQNKITINTSLKMTVKKFYSKPEPNRNDTLNKENTTGITKLKNENRNSNISTNPVSNNSIITARISVDVYHYSNKRDQETQTEEIFFKKHWTYFKALNYKILSSTKIQSKSIEPLLKLQSNRINTEKDTKYLILNKLEVEKARVRSIIRLKNINIKKIKY